MAKFNFKKFSKKSGEKSHEQRLENSREEQKTSAPENITGSLESLLEDKREGKNHLTKIEKQLDKTRENKIWNGTIEAQLDNHEVPKEYPHRDGKDKHDQLPINLLEEARHQEKLKAYAKEEDDAAKSDGSKQPNSQLHNHEDRFKKLTDKDVRNNKKVKEMVTASLIDADGMLYFIYRNAKEEKRELTNEERSLISGINADKEHLTSILFDSSQLPPPKG